MAKEGQLSGVSSQERAKNGENERNKVGKASDSGTAFLNLVAEIIVEIIIREVNERNRIYKKK